MYIAIMSLSYIGSLLYMAMNDYQELLSSYVAQNNELQVAYEVQMFQSEDLHQWNYKNRSDSRLYIILSHYGW